MIDTKQSIFQSARSFFAGTALSRISGLLRDMSMAVAFGSGSKIASFMVAYRLAYLFRRLLGEGNLQAGFTPQFVSLKEKGPFFFRDAAFSMAIFLLAVVGIIELFLWGVLSFVSNDWKEIIELAMWMAPGLVFISLSGLNSALLQCQKKYFLPAFAPVAFNLIWVAAVLIRPDVHFLAMAITIAFIGQWFVTFLQAARVVSWKLWFKPDLFSSDFRTLIHPLSLGIIGIGASQLNSALDAIFARLADSEGPAFLWYATRLQQLPQALFGMALSGALLPPLTRAVDPDHRKELLQGALQSSAALMLFCTFGIFALGHSAVNLLYGRGDFSPSDVQNTCRCLWAYGLGLIPSVFVLLLAAANYSQKNYRTPTQASLISVGVNIGLNALFVFGLGWGAVSIALATSISSAINAALLSKGCLDAPFWKSFSSMAFVGAVSAVTVHFVEQVLFPLDSRQVLQQMFQFGSLFLLYCTPFVLFRRKILFDSI